ncbi:MAG TPA: excinuclease ABC subunit UvrA [Chthoniobacterales bacterium]|nr:excinuclease ABC subunit UvrA [Chthoniobacterales bacterium]
MSKIVASDPRAIVIRGARQNNLKGIDLDLELNKLHVVTGPSGSGKSSLAFDTIYAEGQRRYVETFSPYTRQFLERMDKPQVDEIRGIPPAIAIEQANRVRTTRSTVGTMTEINDYLKLFMPRLARAFCPECHRAIVCESAQSIAEKTIELLHGKRALVCFGVPAPPGTVPEDFFRFLHSQGFLRVWLNQETVRTDAPATIDRLPALVTVIQDRLTIDAGSLSRLTEAIEQALRYGKEQLTIVEADLGVDHKYSTGWHCPYCDVDIRPPSPGLFSFNNPVGACPDCRGFGRTIGIDINRAIPDRHLSLAGGAIKPFQTAQMQECQRDLIRNALQHEVDIHMPFQDLGEADQKWVIEGEISPNKSAEEVWENGGWYGLRGFFDWMESRSYKMHVRVFLSRYRTYTLCRACNGTRFKPETLNFRILTRGEQFTLPQLQQLPLDELINKLVGVAVAAGDSTTELLRTQIVARLQYLVDVGLGYLTLDRPTRSLSGGELQRVNLTTCLGASLVSTLFVLDEPSVGLHPRDIDRLVAVLHGLRDKGNTLLVVEHEEAVIRAADSLIEIGPGRGEHGGQLVFQGPLEHIEKALPDSLTAAYLTGRKKIATPQNRRRPKQFIEVVGAAEHNLQNLTVRFPLSVFCCVTGVSGSGKSTLVQQVLYQNLLTLKGRSGDEAPGLCARLIGGHLIDDVILVDQSPLARTPRSTPAVYVGVFDQIRELFASQPSAKATGLTAGAFSFNSGAGRCERCGGLGFEKVEMQFLSDQFIRCADCEGKRYQAHVLEIKVGGKSIHDFLEMTVTEAITFLTARRDAPAKVLPPLSLLSEVGLGYLRLGQPVNVLSGGESQRLKLVGHLTENSRADRRALLIFDEPTSGLHFDDIPPLLAVFNQLVDRGNSILVIEHNLEVIQAADYVIDLGPEAGVNGGRLVAEGTPEQVVKVSGSHTGAFLGERLAEGRRPALTSRAAEQRAIITPPGISVVGARHHNLKNLSIELPREQMIVITGLSGSGKSSLAFDILFAEGQRRFLDSMSTYARQFVEQMERPDVDHVEGLPPSVAIEQRLTSGGGKSTVATVTEVYHFLRLLFAKLGTQYCPTCNVAVTKQSQSAIARQVREHLAQGPVSLLAPVVKARKGFHKEVAAWATREGYAHLVVDQQRYAVADFPKLERFREHSIEVVIGDLRKADAPRVAELVKDALRVGNGSAFLTTRKGGRTVLSSEMTCPSCGRAFEELDPRLFSFNSPHGWCDHCRGFGYILPFSDEDSRAESVLEAELNAERRSDWVEEAEKQPCPTCRGSRLNEVARAVRVRGQTLEELASYSVKQALDKLTRFKFSGPEKAIADTILSEIKQRLSFMQRVGLEYLALSRAANTLSGGESQRIRLAAQLGSNLRGVLYVLDEPTIGLHPRDNVRLLETLDALKLKGNTLVVVEHDEDTMRRADLIVDLGPGAGRHGGNVIARGPIEELQLHGNSVTGRYLRSPMPHPSRARRPVAHVPWIEIKGARANNLKEIDVSFPIGRLTAITGVSGSGKSTLMRSVLLPAVQQSWARKRSNGSGDWKKISGTEFLSAVYEVDQSPIGKTSRSIPATYVKIFDEIRKQFAQLPESRIRGYDPSRFSFNTEGGRCEVCAGQGLVKLEMNFLPSSYVLCDSCRGKRFNAQTLSVEFNGRSIGDILEMTIEEAAEFFRAQPRIHQSLQLLVETGLGYLQLGQPSPTLSGGEAQRLKLVSELSAGLARDRYERIRKNRDPKSTLYLLEEPTIGLHMADVQLLLEVLHRLVDEGNSVVVIEHNLDVIAEADYIVDIGPEAGAEGGSVVATGTPEEVSVSRVSRTAPFLARVLGIKNGRNRSAA